MRKKHSLVIVIAFWVLVILVVASPVAAQVLTQPKFTQPKWINNTIRTYAVKDAGGGRVGSVWFRYFTKQGDGTQAMVRYQAEGSDFSEFSEVMFSPANFLPVRSTRKLVTKDRVVYYTTTYNPREVRITTRVNDEVPTKRIDQSSGSLYDFEQLPFLATYVDLGSVGKASVYVVHPNELNANIVILQDGGHEVVTVGGRSWNCQRVKYNFKNIQQSVWYAQGKDFVEIIKYDTGGEYIFWCLDAVPSPNAKKDSNITGFKETPKKDGSKKSVDKPKDNVSKPKTDKKTKDGAKAKDKTKDSDKSKDKDKEKPKDKSEKKEEDIERPKLPPQVQDDGGYF